MRAKWLQTALLVAVVLVVLQTHTARAGDPNGWMFRRSYWSHSPDGLQRAYGPAYPPEWYRPTNGYLQANVVYGWRYLNDHMHVGSAHDHVYHREYYWRAGPLW